VPPPPTKKCFLLNEKEVGFFVEYFFSQIPQMCNGVAKSVAKNRHRAVQHATNGYNCEWG
jgi:hypothetical protein